jgi:CRP/FNR family transcriptional regulator, anaerobic regulatory protein
MFLRIKCALCSALSSLLHAIVLKRNIAEAGVMTDELAETRHVLAAFDAATQAALRAEARAVNLPIGTRVFEPGQTADAFLIVTRGVVRVQLTAANGREIMLYRVEAGESCVLTTSCLLDAEAYGAEAICETDIAALAVPRVTFRRLLNEMPAFRDAILASYASRVADLITTIEETHLHRVDARLAALIVERAQDGGIRATHQEIAIELGTAREVVSRTLKRFEHAGAVTLGRGLIEIKDRDRLAHLAQIV